MPVRLLKSELPLSAPREGVIPKGKNVGGGKARGEGVLQECPRVMMGKGRFDVWLLAIKPEGGE